MVAISFSEERFVEMILDGHPWRKDQTTRPFSPARWKMLQTATDLQLYFKQRSPAGFKIADARKSKVLLVRLTPTRPHLLQVEDVRFAYDTVLSDSLTESFARKDGFESYAQMYAWFLDAYGQERLNTSTWIVVRWYAVRRCVP